MSSIEQGGIPYAAVLPYQDPLESHDRLPYDVLVGPPLLTEEPTMLFSREDRKPMHQVLAPVIDKYQRFHNLEPNGESSWSHNMVTDELYSRSFLPVIEMIGHEAELREDQPILHATHAALAQLDTTLAQLDSYAQTRGITPKQAFLRMRSDVLRGKGEAFYTFTAGMKAARDYAYTVINGMPDGYIAGNPSITIQNGRKTIGAFDEIRAKAIAEYEQAEHGIDFGETFTQKLHDPNTKLIVFSIDINSTINDRETAANTALLDSTMAELQFMAEEMKAMYGYEKQILLVLNTGRPALYAWGTAEMLPPIPELRVLGIAEAGGVVFRIEDTQLKAETPVEEPQLWVDALERINQHLQGKIKGTVRVEPKLSMLSMELAQREGGHFLYESIDGEPIDPAWIQREVDAYLTTTHDQLEEEIETVASRMEKVPDVTTFITELRRSRLEGNTAQTREYLHVVLEEEQQELRDRLNTAVQALTTIDMMRATLVCNFNPTAGFIDIGNKNFNKFSTLLGEIHKMNYTTDEALIVHIGDSSTDDPPTEGVGFGESNEGVDTIHLVAVGNATTRLKNAAHARGDYGRVTARDAILGLQDTITGMQRALAQNPLAA